MPKQKSAKALKASRDGYRNTVGSLIVELQILLQNESLTEPQIVETKVILQKLQTYAPNIEDLDDAILDKLNNDDEALTAEALEASAYREKLIHAIATAQVRLDSAHKPSSTKQDDTSSIGSANRVANKPSIKLTKLEIPKFSGDPLSWQSFWDSFESTIHSSADLPTIDKYKYLRSYLEGDALRTIEGYRLTEALYSTVCQVLKERFGNTEIAIQSHFEALLEVPKADEDRSIRLQQIYDDCERHIRSLVALGLSEDQFGKVFVPIILQKIPRQIRIQLYRSKGSESWRLSKLQELLKEEMSAREMSDRHSRNVKEKPDQLQSSGKKANMSDAKKKPSMPTQGALANPSQRKVSCAMCSGDHYSDRCTKFASAADRKKQLGTLKKCFKCLSNSHIVKNCPKSSTCYYCKSTAHHLCLCQQKFGGTSSNTDSGQGCILTGMPKSDQSIGTLTGSLLQEQLFRALKSPVVGEELISAASFEGKRRKNTNYQVTEIDIPVPAGPALSIEALVTKSISCPLQKYPIDVGLHRILQTVPLADTVSQTLDSVSVDMLVGADYYFSFVGSERIQIDEGLFLIASKLGYILTGRVPTMSTLHTTLFNVSTTVHPQNWELEKLWSLEEIGVKDNPYDNDDDMAMEAFNSTVRYTKGRYEVRFPWKDANPDLKNHFGLSVGRLKSLINNLANKPEVLSAYDSTIRGQLNSGIIEEVPKPEIVHPKHLCHYIPHHCVVRQDKATTKLRVVYDASAKTRNSSVSLNECLLRGPVILQDLCGMLLRFRTFPEAFVCDVEKAFLQVGLAPSDRDVTRFLWLKDTAQPVSTSNLRTLRFCRVPFGIISSPFLLAATIKYHLKKHDSDTSNQVARNIYVDNIIGGCKDGKSLLDSYQEIKAIFEEIGMNVREWMSNNKEFVSSIPIQDKGNDMPKVLGMVWDTQQDQLYCHPPKFGQLQSTKRYVAQVISAVFDPCGFFCPISIQGKQIIQDLWREKTDWDDKLPKSLNQQFRQLLPQLERISEVPIPRLLNSDPKNAPAYEIHCFCDASQKVYATATYLRIIRGDHVECRLLFAKARLAPIKPVSIPRLELMAVTLGVTVTKFILRELELPVNQTVVWTDSKCVLFWLASKKLQPVFVENRLKSIRSAEGFLFRYVPTTCNPADIPTKITDLASLKQSNLWWFGPRFLVLNSDLWPESAVDSMVDLSVDETHLEIETLLNSTDIAKLMGIGDSIDITKFSSLLRIVRVTAWVLRFCNRVKDGHRGGPSELSAREIENGTRVWLQSAQMEANLDPLRLPKNLGAFKDDQGLIRCAGRLQNLDDHQSPILIPKNHRLSFLLIEDCHRRLHHAGARQTLAQLRLTYWLPSGLYQVQKVIRSCQVCRFWEGGPAKLPECPPLPSFRLKQDHPFTSSGVDYLGPLFVKTDTEPSKVWICLFTCAAVRAVHLEVVLNLSTEQFLLGLRRFIANYGCPKLLISDNGTQFKSANRILGQLAKSQDVLTTLSSQGIEWKFIPEFAPWMGGFYERLVGSVKRAIRKTFGKGTLDLIRLQTVVAEVAAVINSRPLLWTDYEIGDEALTPAHFLGRSIRRGLPQIPNEVETNFTSSSDQDLLLRWRRGQKLLDQFWLCWRREYLSSLRDRQLPSKRGNNTSTLDVKPGCIVLLKENLPRCRWKLGRVCDLIKSRDELVRSATIQLGSGRKVVRPINLLYPIETSIDTETTAVNTVSPFERCPDSAVSPIGRYPNSDASPIGRCINVSPVRRYPHHQDASLIERCIENTENVPCYSNSTASLVERCSTKSPVLQSLQYRNTRKSAKAAAEAIKSIHIFETDSEDEFEV